MNDVARRLLASEIKGQQGSKELANATERVWQRLRGHLSRLIGQDGSHALLSRSLRLAQRRFSLLQSVKATPGADCVEGLQETIQDQDPAAAFEMCIGIIESIIALFASFVGEGLARKLVEEAFINPVDAEATNEGTTHE